MQRDHQREEPGLHHRDSDLSPSSPDNTGIFTLIASSDAPVQFRDEDGVIYREILSHKADAVSTTTCRSLLINHDRNQIVGSVQDITFENGRSIVKVKVSADAKLATGMRVCEAIKEGALRGVSIGYTYDAERDCSYDATTRTVTVNKWRWAEVTLTPIPRDATSHVRSFSQFKTHKPEETTQERTSETTMDLSKLLAIQKANPDLAIAIGERAAAGDDLNKIDAFINQERERARLSDVEKTRAAELQRLKLRDDIVTLAETHSMRATPFLEHKSLTDAGKAILAAKAKAEQERSADNNFRLTPSDVVVTKDGGDKLRDAAADAFMANIEVPVKFAEDKPAGNYSRSNKDLGLRGKSFHSIARRFAAIEGHEDAMDWGQDQITRYIFTKFNTGSGLTLKSRAGANETTGMFTNLLINVMDKALTMGYSGFEAITYDQWCKIRPVMDFKTYAGAALTLGNLVQTAEEAVFPEIGAKDVGYTAALAMYGATLTLTYQAIYNDDLGEFFANLGKAGMVARRTIDRQAYITLLGGTWTNDTTSSSALANSGALDTVRSDFRHKKNPLGQFLGNNPSILLHPLSLARAAQTAVGQLSPPGEQAYLAGAGVRSMRAIEVVYLDDPTITGFSASNYYVTGDPGTVDTVVVGMLQGMATPQVMEFDAGATASRKFKIFLPFQTTLPSYTDSNALVRIPGIQKGTP